MAAEGQGALLVGCPTSSPLDRDPRQFPVGVLLVAPGIFEAVSGFAWFDSEAKAIEYLRYDVWTMVDLDQDRKRACMRVFEAVLADCNELSQDIIDVLGQGQDELLVLWGGTFWEILEGAEGPVLALLADTVEQVGVPELLRSPEGVLRLMAEYRWQFTGGAGGIRREYESLGKAGQLRFLSDLRCACQGSCP